jgi:hypothetical protein
MKSYKQMVNEVLNKMTPLETWIDDFVHSKNSKFAGKSTAERIAMAKGAYYAKQRRESVEEAAAVSQNSTAEVSMTEDHLVHVSDGSGYDDTPHPKDIEHIKTGAMHTGGEWHGHSDKGAFFKFKSKEDAEHFKRHVDKCPHKSCYADHVNEAVEYKGIGTDVVDKKKKLNPQPNFTTDKKQVKDFKEEAEQIDELDKKTIGSYAKKATKDLKWQQTMRPFDAKRISNREKGIDKAIDKLTKEEVEQVDESSLHRQHFQMVADLIRGHESAEKRKELAHHHAELFKKANPRFDHAKFMKASGVNEEVELEEAKVYDPFTKKMVATKPIKVQAGGGATKNGVPVETGPSKYKQSLKKEEVELIDELSKDTLASYAKKASHDARIKQHVAADFKSKEAHARNPRKKETWGSIAKKYQSKAWKREDGHDKAVDKLAKEEEQIDELSVKTMKSAGDKLAGKALEFHGDDNKHYARVYASKALKVRGGLERRKYLASKGKYNLESVQIDEVSKSTLMRYIPKASRDVGSHTYAGKEAGEWASHYTRAGDWSAAEKHSKKSYADFKKANKRIAGIDTATKKLGTQKEEVELDESTGLPHALVQVGKSKWHIYDTKTREVHSTYNNKNVAMKKYGELNDKHAGYDSPGGLVHSKYGVRQEPMRKEEVQVDEAIAKKLPVQHAVDAVHATLGPKSATRFLSHLSPGTDKHTSWDKVNDALVKQGVQTHHIASIAQKTSHMNEEVIDESRGHKVLNTFFKNREVAQRAYQGNPAKDAEVAQGGGSPADQGIAAAKKDAEELKKKVSEAKAPVVHAAEPKKTKSTPKEYASAAIPGTKRVTRGKPDDNEVGGGTATRVNEDQYTSEYKIKSYVDPVTGENKTRKIRPHRINFKSSKMNAAPAQMTEPTKVTEDDKVYDEKWKKVKFTDFIKGAK